MKARENSTTGARLAVRVLFGFVVLIAGGVLALPGVPGPGLPLILFGLWLLRDHFEWAGRSFTWLREKTGRFRPAQRRRQLHPSETATEVPERR